MSFFDKKASEFTRAEAVLGTDLIPLLREINEGVYANRLASVTELLGPLIAGDVTLSTLPLSSGGSVDWNNGDVRITHLPDILLFSGALLGYFFDNGLAANGEIHAGGSGGGFAVHRRDLDSSVWIMYSTAGALQWYSAVASADRMVLDDRELTLYGRMVLDTGGTVFDSGDAQFHTYRTVQPSNDRAGAWYSQVVRTGGQHTAAHLRTYHVPVLHEGPGFDINDASIALWENVEGPVLDFWSVVMSPSDNAGDQTWDSGIIYSGEFNFGNRWADQGLLRTVYSSKWVGGVLFVPDVVDAADGESDFYAYNANFAIVFGERRHGDGSVMPAKIWNPINFAEDCMPAGGVGIVAHGGTLIADRPLAFLELFSFWDYGLDLKGGSYSIAPIRLPNNTSLVARNAADTTDIGLIKLSGDNLVVIKDLLAVGPDFVSLFSGNFLMGNGVSLSGFSGTTYIGGWNGTAIVPFFNITAAATPTLTFTNMAFPNYADDTAAGVGGVAVGSLYRTGSLVKVRVA